MTLSKTKSINYFFVFKKKHNQILTEDVKTSLLIHFASISFAF